MKSTKVQTLSAGHALAKHLVESEDIRQTIIKKTSHKNKKAIINIKKSGEKKNNIRD